MRIACYLKLLKALQEDTGNNTSYLVPMNTVSQNLLAAEGGGLPRDKVHPHPPIQLSCMLSFLCYDKGNEKGMVI